MSPSSPSSLSFPLNEFETNSPVVCMDCGRPIPPGSPYSLRLDSFDATGMDWSDVVCATGYCNTPPPLLDRRQP